MFLSVSWCAELMTWLHRHRFKVTQSHVIYPLICVRCISSEVFVRFSLNLTKCLSQWDGVQNQLLSYADSRSRSHFKFIGCTLEFRILSVFPQAFVRFSLNITQMFLSVSWCAQPVTQLHILKVKVTVQGHGFYPWISRTLHILNPLNDFH